MLESVLRVFSRPSLSERVAALTQKLSRLQADLRDMEQEIRSSSAFADAGLEPSIQEIEALFANIRAGLESLAPVVAGHTGRAPEVEATLKTAADRIDSQAARIKTLRDRVRGYRPQG